MNVPVLVLAASCALGVLVLVVWLHRRLRRSRPLAHHRTLGVTIGGALSAIFALWVQIGLLGGVQPVISSEAGWGGLVLMLALRVPIEEALKVAVVWPLYLGRKLLSGTHGVTYAVFSACGFGAAEIVFLCADPGASGWTLLRVVIAFPAHLFFAAVWGYMLGGSRRDRYFGAVWLGATLLHGLYDHIVFEQKAAFLVVLFPMILSMAWAVRALFRDESEVSSPRLTAYSLFEAPSMGSVRQAFEEKRPPLKLRWILMGSFVNLGVILSFVALGVIVGHRFGVDFALVDEQGEGGYLAIGIVGGSLLSAFPVAAFLVARASATRTVLEPAWAMAAAIVSVLVVFSVTEPSALIIALAIAPVGFLLACAGALLGIRRR